MNNQYPLNGKYKLFLVEMEDDDRERVLSAHVIDVQLDYNVDQLLCSNDIGTYKLTARLTPNSDGHAFKLENFLEEDEDA